MPALILIDFMHRRIELAIKVFAAPHANHCLRVLRKATAAVTKAGIQELIPDPLVSTHAFAH